MLDRSRDAMRNPILQVHRVQPRSRAIVCGCRVEESAIVEQHRIRNLRVVRRDSFRRTAAIGGDAPDVHLVWWQPFREIDEPAVGRPREIMAMHPRLGDENSSRAGAVAVGDVDRIAGRRLVIRQLRSVRRPGCHDRGF